MSRTRSQTLDNEGRYIYLGDLFSEDKQTENSQGPKLGDSIPTNSSPSSQDLNNQTNTENQDQEIIELLDVSSDSSRESEYSEASPNFNTETFRTPLTQISGTSPLNIFQPTTTGESSPLRTPLRIPSRQLNLSKKYRIEKAQQSFLNKRRILDSEILEEVIGNPGTAEDQFSNTIMALSYTDIINAIPVFDGDRKDLDYFISTCSTYNSLISAEQRTTFISIVKTKLKGLALTKMQPLDNIINWKIFSDRLEEKFRKPITFEHSQDAIGNIRQGWTETIEKYGNRMRLAFYELNESSKTLSDNAEALSLLNKANEKLAIRKFEQNLQSNNVRIWVGAKTHETLDEAISFAIKKEDLYSRNPTCNFCHSPGHTYEVCRKRLGRTQTGPRTNGFQNSNSNNTQRNDSNNYNNGNSRPNNFKRNNPNNFNWNNANNFNKANNRYNNFYRNESNNRTFNNGNNFNRNNNGNNGYRENDFGSRSNNRNGNSLNRSRNSTNSPPNSSPPRTNRIFVKDSKMNLEDVMKNSQSETKN